MPKSNGAYISPTWVNGTDPAITPTEMQAITDTLELVPVANGGTGLATADDIKESLAVPKIECLLGGSGTALNALTDFLYYYISPLTYDVSRTTLIGAYVDPSDSDIIGEAIYVTGIIRVQIEGVYLLYLNRSTDYGEALSINIVLARWDY